MVDLPLSEYLIGLATSPSKKEFQLSLNSQPILSQFSPDLMEVVNEH